MNGITVSSVLSVINQVENFQISESQMTVKLIELGIDSVGFIKIIVALEERFECEIPDTMLLMTELDTVEKIYDVLYQLKGDKI